MADWLERFYEDTDAMDGAAFASHFAEDGVLRFANAPATVGREQIHAAIDAFFASIGGLRHEFHHRFDDGDRTVVETTVHYTRKDGSVVSVPGATAAQRRDEEIEELRIYIDLAPLSAEG